MTSIVSIEDLSFRYANNEDYTLKNVSFTALPGEITTIVGANGAGKTTLLKCIAHLMKYEGSVKLDGAEPDYNTLTEKVSYLEQDTGCNINLSVFEVVMLGLVKTLGFRVSDEDIEKVNNVLSLVGIEHLAGRIISEISGGQRQLAFIAQALVKDPDVLILDEPTSALDLYNQFTLINFIREITKKKNCTTIMTLHHLDVAMKYSDRVVVISGNQVYDDGLSNEVFIEKMFYEVYRVHSRIETDEEGQRHLIVLHPKKKGEPDNYEDLVDDPGLSLNED